jgi:hypothetical protein
MVAVEVAGIGPDLVDRQIDDPADIDIGHVFLLP